MNIDCQKKTITFDCGHTVQIQKAALYRCTDFQPYLFDCDHCHSELNIPLAFNDLLEAEILENVNSPNQDDENKPDELSDIFLGENQVPITPVGILTRCLIPRKRSISHQKRTS